MALTARSASSSSSPTITVIGGWPPGWPAAAAAAPELAPLAVGVLAEDAGMPAACHETAPAAGTTPGQPGATTTPSMPGPVCAQMTGPAAAR